MSFINIQIDTSQVVSELNEAVNDKVNKLASSIWTNLVDTTPVASGRARASWFIDQDATRDPLPEGVYGYPLQPYIPNALPVVIYNPVGYIEYLNEGSSEQAPSMFVELAVENAIRGLV